MTGKVNRRSAYERASPVNRGIWGKPAAATVIGMFFWVARCSALIRDRYSSSLTNWTSSSMKTTPVFLAAAASPSAKNSSERSREIVPSSALRISTAKPSHRARSP